MLDKVPYEYSIIRVVPKVEREEFINVGVILFSKRKKFLDMKFFIAENKLSALSNEIDLVEIENYLKAWELVCEGQEAGGCIGALELPSRFRWLTASRSTIIQSSAVHPGLSNEPEVELDKLFQKFVL